MEPLAHKKCFCNSVLHGSKTHSAPEGFQKYSLLPSLPFLFSPCLPPTVCVCVLYVLHVYICVIMCISTGMHFHGKHVDTRAYGVNPRLFESGSLFNTVYASLTAL